MIHDLEKIDNSNLNINYDICIVGAGAAGITLANKLSGKGLKVILCEAGSREYTEVSQKNYAGKIKGDPYFDLDIARLRYLGGTTNHWNGMCRPFEKIDFERNYLGEGFIWPIKYDEISKYQKEACEILEIRNDFLINYESNEIVKKINFRNSTPVRFKDKYINKLTNSSNLTLILSCTGISGNTT